MTVEQVGTFLLGHGVATLGFCLGTVAVRGRTPPRWMVPWHLTCNDDPDNPPPLSPDVIAETRCALACVGITAFMVGVRIVYEAFR